MRRSWLPLSAAILAASCSSGPTPKPDTASTEATPVQTAPAVTPAPAQQVPAQQTPAESAASAPTQKTPVAGEHPAPLPVQTPAAWTSPVSEALQAAVDMKAMDTSVSPCDDFYQYACGNWVKTTKIPADKPAWTRSFSSIFEKNEALLKKIMEDDAAGKADKADPFARKVGAFYGTCMDEAKAETGSLQALKAELAKIDKLKSVKQLGHLVGTMQQLGQDAFFRFASEQDAKDATQVIASADQGGLGLPDRDYYLKDDARMKSIRDAYVAHVEKMLTLIGEKPEAAKADAADILALETELAKVSMDKVSRRDPYKVYHRINRDGLVKLAPHFNWKGYFHARQHPGLKAIDVNVTEFFSGMDKLLTSTPMPKLKTYLRWKALEASAMAMGKDFVNERFNFVHTLTGQKELSPRWKRCVQMTNSALGEAVGRTFVETTIGEKGKAEAKQMVASIEAAMGEDLKSLDWMDAETQTKAIEKLNKIANKIGYPDKWRDYKPMKIGTQSLLANLQAAARFESNRDLDKIGKPVDRTEWLMTAATVNAYYDPSKNEMVFPAGILQTPFFGPDMPAAANFGGAGMVMGHELTHGFDDQGSQYDGNGNLRNWWSKDSEKNYKARTGCVVKQYDGYAVGDAHLNGALTQGENIADIGGLKLAHAALAAKNGGKVTPEQERAMFISFAQDWCSVRTPQFARLLVTVDPHSAPRWRVNGPVSDNPDFARAFQCTEGAKMAPKDRCQVW